HFDKIFSNGWSFAQWVNKTRFLFLKQIFDTLKYLPLQVFTRKTATNKMCFKIKSKDNLQKRVKKKKKASKRQKMFLDAHKAGFKSEWSFVVTMVINLICGLYCLGLLFLSWWYMWQKATPRSRNVSMNSDAQSTSQIEMRELNVNDISNVDPRPTNVHKHLKLVVILYITSCILNCIGTICERFAYAAPSVSASACNETLYVFYVRVVTDSLFFLFYVIRVLIILRGSVFELPKWRQWFFMTAPSVTFGTLFVSSQIRAESRNCHSDPQEVWYLTALICCQFFWNVVLFVFLRTKFTVSLSKKKKKKVANDKLISDKSCRKGLKEYLKRLLRLFLITELFDFVTYTCILVTSLHEMVWSVMAIELCLNCTSMVLSFAFAKSIFDFVCLCKR
ncbi:hypothetical protein RFI_30924, partial [Reticulomyxa filosa]